MWDAVRNNPKLTKQQKADKASEINGQLKQELQEAGYGSQ